MDEDLNLKPPVSETNPLSLDQLVDFSLSILSGLPTPLLILLFILDNFLPANNREMIPFRNVQSLFEFDY